MISRIADAADGLLVVVILVYAVTVAVIAVLSWRGEGRK